jgi:hypothetical protein
MATLVTRRFRVLRESFINKTRYKGGDIVNIQVDPNTFHAGDNLEEITPEQDSERAEMEARHAKELDELDHVKQREALIEKQRLETAEFNHKAAVAALAEKNKREDEALKVRQARESAAFGQPSAATLVPPPEVVKEELDKRHAAEAEALKEKHEAEVAELEARKPGAVAEAPVPANPT